MITGLPIGIEDTSPNHAPFEFVQSRCILTCRLDSADRLTVILDNLPLYYMFLAVALSTFLMSWSFFDYKTMMKGFMASRSPCGFLLHKCLDLQMAIVVQSHAPIAPQSKADSYLAPSNCTSIDIYAMVYYVLDLFDQLHSCILAYEQIVCHRDEAIKGLRDEVVVLKRSNTTKDKDLTEYKRSQTATNGVNTRLQTEVTKKAERIVTLKDELGEEKTKCEDLEEVTADLRAEASKRVTKNNAELQKKDKIISTRDKEIKDLTNRLKNAEASHAQELKIVKEESAQLSKALKGKQAATESHCQQVQAAKSWLIESRRNIAEVFTAQDNGTQQLIATVQRLKEFIRHQQIQQGKRDAVIPLACSTIVVQTVVEPSTPVVPLGFSIIMVHADVEPTTDVYDITQVGNAGAVGSKLVVPPGEQKPKGSGKKKRRRRKRSNKAENANDDTTAGDERFEEPSDDETDSNPDFSTGEGNATNDPSTGTGSTPDFVPVNPSQFRAGPAIINRSPPPMNAPTGPRGHAPFNAPRGAQAARPTTGPSGAGAEGAFVQPSEFTMSLYVNQLI